MVIFLDDVFGGRFWGIVRDVPTGEGCKHEEEKLQGAL
jgi:hypothetical protein